jgi:aryl-alcohol dehydrogenase-like predicted oxidoreductase/histidinol phosphatase-like enzyme/predicted kinase
MRLSTAADRDDDLGISVVHAALDAGVRLLDTADVYCHDDGDIGHNERLIARALSSWSGDSAAVRVATKGGLTRPRGRWVPDGRGKHLQRAAEASAVALGVTCIDLYQLHVVDSRAKLETSVRAIAALQRAGVVRAIGLCNVNVDQIERARAVAEIASVQVALDPLGVVNLRNGVVEYCADHGIELLSYSPLGGPKGATKLGKDAVVQRIAERHRATPHQIALAWARDLHASIIPLPGPSRPDTARSAAEACDIELSDVDRAELDERFPAGRIARGPRAERKPPDDADGDVVLIMGYPAAGKTTLARELVDRGYERLNRDELGGRLRGLVPRLDAALASGQRTFVLDNTYASRASRNEIVETAWRHGVPARCVHLTTSLEDAQINAVERMLATHGELLAGDALARASKKSPNTFGPQAQFRYRRELEPPIMAEGFARLDRVEFARDVRPDRANRALILEYQAVWRSRSGARSPMSPDDVELIADRADVVRRYRDDGWMILGTSWRPEIAAGQLSESDVEAIVERTNELIGVDIDVEVCPHADGPPKCWCRKPHPGMGVILIERHALDPARCVAVGTSSSDRLFADRLGFGYSDHSELFGSF